jgi:hypothetical protein
MNRFLYLPIALLAGCSIYPTQEHYSSQTGDPTIFVQSLVDTRGTIPNRTGTIFAAIYPNADNDCRTMFLPKLFKPTDDPQLRSNIENDNGLKVPANRLVSLLVRYNQAHALGGGYITEMKCPLVTRTILTEPNGKYLFQFHLNESQCLVDVFDVKDSGILVKIEAIPFLMCNDGK